MDAVGILVLIIVGFLVVLIFRKDLIGKAVMVLIIIFLFYGILNMAGMVMNGGRPVEQKNELPDAKSADVESCRDEVSAMTREAIQAGKSDSEAMQAGQDGLAHCMAMKGYGK